MARGKTPDPSAKRRDVGKRGPKKLAAIEVLGARDRDTLAPPADLPPVAADIWRLAVDEMSGNRQLREIDTLSLRMLCDQVYVHAEASANIYKFGVLVKGERGPMPNPLIKVQKDSASTILRLCDVLGLNPLSRIRLGLMEVTGESMVFDLRERLLAKVVKG